jgi:tRNA G18 (ribose-2'-O)-methylase SpoU
VRVIRIDEAGDARLAPYVGVREPKPLRDAGLLIAEGRFVVRRLLGGGHVRFRSLLLNEAAFAALRDAIDQAADDLAVYVAPPDVIAAATGFDIHRGCLALADRPAPLAFEGLLAMTAPVVVLERVVDPDNIGSVFRNAEAFGAGAVLLAPGCGDPLYRKALRTSSGSALMVPFAAAEPWPEALDRLRTAGFLVAAMTPAPDAVDIGDFVRTADAQRRLAVLFGSEGDGLTPGALSRADVRVRIPINPGIDSLNIATTAGIALHRLQDAARTPAST